MWRTHRGITLIEVLVVMAIVGILAALTASVTVRVKERALRTSCATNLSQIGKALHLYLGANDDYFPPYRTSPVYRKGVTYPAESREWRDSLEAFGARGSVWLCPASPGLGPPAGASPAHGAQVHGISSYELSRHMYIDQGSWPDGRLRLSGSHEAILGYAMDLNYYPGPSDEGPAFTSHGHYGNVVYTDGHVEGGLNRVIRR